MIGKEDEESKGKKDNCLGGKFLYKMSKTKWIKEKIFLFILFYNKLNMWVFLI